LEFITPSAMKIADGYGCARVQNVASSPSRLIRFPLSDKGPGRPSEFIAAIAARSEES
jgi:hypothetical protein